MSSFNIQAPRGTKDILPAESPRWHEVERAVREVAESFGYDEIRTPMFEQSKLFKRSVGEETDIVSKEMYLFEDKGGEEFALRPELTASVVRASIEHNLITGQAPCARLYYNSAPNFRYEKPQLGRQRQFHQFGTELLGPSSPLADAETILFAISVYRKLGLSQFQVKLNSLASRDARAAWKELLVNYLRGHLSEMSEESRRRTETNPMRVLDSKDERDRAIVQNAPRLLEHLTIEDREHFETLQQLLTNSGISYVIDPYLVRGLDYYSRTVFELTSTDLGSQDALCGGGRYDHLIEQLGGPATPAVGFAAGVERVLIVLEKLRQEHEAAGQDVYIISTIAEGRQKAFILAEQLRAAGLRVTYDLQERSMKAQMREANRIKARFVLILQEDELANASVTVKDMKNSTQEQRQTETLASVLVESKNTIIHSATPL